MVQAAGQPGSEPSTAAAPATTSKGRQLIEFPDSLKFPARAAKPLPPQFQARKAWPDGKYVIKYPAGYDPVTGTYTKPASDKAAAAMQHQEELKSKAQQRQQQADGQQGQRHKGRVALGGIFNRLSAGVAGVAGSLRGSPRASAQHRHPLSQQQPADKHADAEDGAGPATGNTTRPAGSVFSRLASADGAQNSTQLQPSWQPTGGRTLSQSDKRQPIVFTHASSKDDPPSRSETEEPAAQASTSKRTPIVFKAPPANAASTSMQEVRVAPTQPQRQPNGRVVTVEGRMADAQSGRSLATSSQGAGRTITMASSSAANAAPAATSAGSTAAADLLGMSLDGVIRKRKADAQNVGRQGKRK